MITSDYPAFKILTFCVVTSSTKRTGFLRLKRKNVFDEKLINILKNPKEFNDILSEYNTNHRSRSIYIHSILRKSDNRVLTSEDETDVYNGPTGIPDYKEKISSFYLDGYSYMGYILKSKSGIQGFFGGGLFVDINDIGLIKTRKEERREKLKNLF